MNTVKLVGLGVLGGVSFLLGLDFGFLLAEGEAVGGVVRAVSAMFGTHKLTVAGLLAACLALAVVAVITALALAIVTLAATFSVLSVLSLLAEYVVARGGIDFLGKVTTFRFVTQLLKSLEAFLGHAHVW